MAVMPIPETIRLITVTLQDAGFTEEQADALAAELQLIRDTTPTLEKFLKALELIEDTARAGSQLARTVNENAESSRRMMEEFTKFSETISNSILDIQQHIIGE